MDFEGIYQSYCKDVFRYLRSLSAGEDLAEEITQETFDAHMDTDVCGYIHYREQEE